MSLSPFSRAGAHIPAHLRGSHGSAMPTMVETFHTHRQMLFGIAYRMLGRVTEAEDMVQETWLRWQKQDAAAIDSAKAWLTSTITRLCIDQLRSTRHQREEYYGVWLPEPLMGSTEDAPDHTAALADSLATAFMMMLETLNPVERAVFLLREVFGYEYADAAAIVEKSEANCRQIVRRAKAQLQAGTLSSPTPPSHHAQQLVQRFVSATVTGNVQDVLSLLAADATVYSDGGGLVKAVGRPIMGADPVSRLFVGLQRFYPADTELRYVPMNGRPGVLMLSQGVVFNAITIDFEDDRVKTVYVVRNPEKLRHLHREYTARM